jgi:predicted ATPase
MALLNRLRLSGFRSIKEMDIELRPLNVMIGANGAGKSNLVAFFKLLNEMMAGRFQQFIATTGRAQGNLHFGPKVTPQMDAKLEFKADNGVDTYYMRLFHAAGDSLVFAEEHLSFLQDGWGKPKEIDLGKGHLETRIGEEANKGEKTARVFHHLLNDCRVFHFHDTSSTARVRQFCYVGDHRWLMPDAGNLAAMLYWWQTSNELAYSRIVRTISQVAPFFAGFDLKPEGSGDRDIMLNWRHCQSDSVFGPYQLSDGTLRAMCLISLLMQPEDELPSVIVVDEPELGLHPFALNIIASLFRAAAKHTQILISTQSSTLLDSFDPGDVVIVERDGEGSRFSRPDPTALVSWLEDYSLGEVWEKNVIGGGPH